MARSRAFFDADRHPRIRFRSAPFDSHRLYAGGDLTGWLNLRGHEQRVRFHVRPSPCKRPGRDCPIRVVGSVRRSDFGMSS